MLPSEFWNSTPKEIVDFIKAQQYAKAHWAYTQASLIAGMFSSVLATAFGKRTPLPKFEDCFKEIAETRDPTQNEQAKPLTLEELRKQQEIALNARIARGRQALQNKIAIKAMQAKIKTIKDLKQEKGTDDGRQG